MDRDTGSVITFSFSGKEVEISIWQKEQILKHKLTMDDIHMLGKAVKEVE